MVIQKESTISREGLLRRLRQRIDAIPASDLSGDLHGNPVSPSAIDCEQSCFSLGCAALDERLPWNGLKTGALHEVVAGTYRDRPAAVGFTAALLVRLLKERSGYVLWVQLARGFRDFGPVYGHGLASLGLDADRLILAVAKDEADVLWAMEEGLHCMDLAGVVGETRAHARAVDLTSSRRLHMAASVTDTTAFLLRGSPDEAVGMDSIGGSAALTRWGVRCAPSALLSGSLRSLATAIGRPRWHVELLRCRSGGATGSFDHRGTGTMTQIVEWNHETHHFHLATPLADRPLLSRPAHRSTRTVRSDAAQANTGTIAI